MGEQVKMEAAEASPESVSAATEETSVKKKKKKVVKKKKKKEVEKEIPKPELSSYLKNFIKKEGESIEMKCRLEEEYEEGDVEMKWYFNDTLIESSDRCMITFDGTYATLFIASCTMEDMGAFKVVFSNKSGSDESTGKVTVKPKPEATKPVEKKVEEPKAEPEKPVEKKKSYKEMREEQLAAERAAKAAQEAPEEPKKTGPNFKITKGRRRGSKDAAGDEKSEWERRLDRPSVPLKATGEPGPPKIVEIQEKYSAVEDQTACCYMFVEGNPAPTFKFYKGATICQEGGRYKLVSDGDNNNMIMLAITKVKSTDEGEYRVVIENCHGSDEKTFMLYVSDSSGMDFRSMLKKKKYAKWGNDDEGPDWGDLKHNEKEEEPVLKKVKEKPDEWVIPLKDKTVKELEDKKVVFQCTFSKANQKAKWCFKGDEIFKGKQYKIEVLEDEEKELTIHQLTISKPMHKNMGKYTCTCNDIQTGAYLDVEEAPPDYHFTKNLPKQTSTTEGEELLVKCTLNTYKASVKWYKEKKEITSDDSRYEIDKDIIGVCTLKIKSPTKDDAGKYSCKIVGK